MAAKRKQRSTNKSPIPTPATQGCREAQPGKPGKILSNDTKKTKKSGRSQGGIQVRRATDGNGCEFVFPAGVRERTEDMEEVRTMLAAGETEIAVEELRWLLGGCQELLEAHKLLGDVALGEGKMDLARGHFGYAFGLGTDALPKRGLDRPLPYAHEANRAFYEAGRGLVQTLLALERRNDAAEVALQLLALDPTDPLDIRPLIET